MTSFDLTQPSRPKARQSCQVIAGTESGQALGATSIRIEEPGDVSDELAGGQEAKPGAGGLQGAPRAA